MTRKIVMGENDAKMARGEMVRFMAENQGEDAEDIKKFDRLRYMYRDDLSCDTEIVFERKGQKHGQDGCNKAE